ncbi:MAG: DUF4384 domain-containing protein [Magnetovibrio sp.]|nr:DUF4384 domain-containing protein [Magnetovibrio sp.]
MTNPQTASVIANATTPVVKNMTGFTNSLRCMDNLFLAFGKKDIMITSDGLPDQTGQINMGSKEIMTSTISKMSTKSRAFKFVDVEQAGNAVMYIQRNWVGRRPIEIPNYYIRGAITQADLGVATDTQGAGIATPLISLGYSQDQMLALVSMDMNMGEIASRQIVPGLHTSNTITIMRSGKGGDAEGIIQKASIFLEMSQNRSQGTHQAVRSLIELSLIEVLGKFTKVPYWRCLEIESTDPMAMTVARDWYDAQKPDERIRLVQTALIKTGDFKGAITGQNSRALQKGINRYKAREDLIANGRIDFDLYYQLLTNNMAVSPVLKPAFGAQASLSPGVMGSPEQNGQAGASGFDPIGLEIHPMTGNALNVQDEIRIEVTTKSPAHVYCYYEGYDQPVTRIFPSRFQTNGFITPGQTIMIPSANAPYSIRPTGKGQEQIACVAVPHPYSQETKPAFLAEGDLEPLSLKRLYEVVNAHQKADPYNTSIQHVSFMVKP